MNLYPASEPLPRDPLPQAVCPAFAVEGAVGDALSQPQPLEGGEVAPEHGGQTDGQAPDGAQVQGLYCVPVLMDAQVVLLCLTQGLREEDEDAQGKAPGKMLPPDSGDHRAVPEAVGLPQIEEEPEKAPDILGQAPGELEQIPEKRTLFQNLPLW